VTKQFLKATKPFCDFGANVLKLLPCTGHTNNAPNRRPGVRTD
jgi:hypothetical protein